MLHYLNAVRLSCLTALRVHEKVDPVPFLVMDLFGTIHSVYINVGYEFVLGTAPSHISIPPNRNGTMTKGR